MRDRGRQADVAEPVVEGEELHVLPRELPPRVVSNREQQSQQNLRGEDADRDQADDRGDVYGCGHTAPSEPLTAEHAESAEIRFLGALCGLRGSRQNMKRTWNWNIRGGSMFARLGSALVALPTATSWPNVGLTVAASP